MQSPRAVRSKSGFYLAILIIRSMVVLAAKVIRSMVE